MNENCKYSQEVNGICTCDRHTGPNAFKSPAMFDKTGGRCYAKEYARRYGNKCPGFVEKVIKDGAQK